MYDMPDEQKSIYSNNPMLFSGSAHGKLLQLVFVNHMSNPDKIIFNVSFACQYMWLIGFNMEW